MLKPPRATGHTNTSQRRPERYSVEKAKHVRLRVLRIGRGALNVLLPRRTDELRCHQCIYLILKHEIQQETKQRFKNRKHSAYKGKTDKMTEKCDDKGKYFPPAND